MVKELIKYPNPSIRLISANIRFFNDELKNWICDMTDTMAANDMQALSAILIGIQYNIIIIKENGLYVPYINARIIKHGGKATATERSVYYDGISVDVDRYEEITVIYEDETGKQNNVSMKDEAARIFQHQLDYSFGSTFVDRVDKQIKERINAHLKFGLVNDSHGDSCPTVFYRDYAKKAAQYAILLTAFSAVTSFFATDYIRQILNFINLYAPIAILFFICGYVLYAGYETKKYKQCTSCQTGNIIGTAAILTIQLFALYLLLFFWIKP